MNLTPPTSNTPINNTEIRDHTPDEESYKYLQMDSGEHPRINE